LLLAPFSDVAIFSGGTLGNPANFGATLRPLWRCAGRRIHLAAE
jgi:hypothetical protein